MSDRDHLPPPAAESSGWHEPDAAKGNRNIEAVPGGGVDQHPLQLDTGESGSEEFEPTVDKTRVMKLHGTAAVLDDTVAEGAVGEAMTVENNGLIVEGPIMMIHGEFHCGCLETGTVEAGVVLSIGCPGQPTIGTTGEAA